MSWNHPLRGGEDGGEGDVSDNVTVREDETNARRWMVANTCLGRAKVERSRLGPGCFLSRALSGLSTSFDLVLLDH